MEASHLRETLPLLGTVQPAERLHYIDNLRATLTVILIFHHAAMQVGSTPLPLTIFTLINRSALWALFFFVSGRSASLAISSSSDYAFFLSRILKVVVPAWIYSLLIRPLLSLALKSIGGQVVWIKISGPTAYVSILLCLDFFYLLLRWCARHNPNFPSLPFLASLRPSSPADFLKAATFTAAALAIFHFIRSILYRIEPHAYYPYLFASYDQPGVDAPLSCIISYSVGVHFDSLKDHLVISLHKAYILLFTSITLAYVSAATYFLFIVWAIPFSGLRFLTQAIIFAAWDTFVFYTLPPAVVSIFSQTPWTIREWGPLARHTYIQTYVNMIPILLADHLVWRIHDNILKTFVIGVFGVAISWTAMVVLMMLWRSIASSIRS